MGLVEFELLKNWSMSSRLKKCHTFFWVKNVVLLVKENKWEGEAIDKKEKLAKGLDELNKNSRHFKLIGENERKLKTMVKAYKCAFNHAKDTVSHKQEKIMQNFSTITEQLSMSI